MRFSVQHHKYMTNISYKKVKLYVLKHVFKIFLTKIKAYIWNEYK